MGIFDHTAFGMCKLDGEGSTGYFLRKVKPLAQVRFAQWDDTRRQSWPGGIERVDDVVAIMERLDAPGQACYLIVENETEADRNALHRLGIYELLLAEELLAKDPPPMVGSVLLRLTGKKPAERPNLGIPGTTLGSRVEPVEVILATESASDTLDDIEAGRVAPCTPALIPLMSCSDVPAVAVRWKQVATLRVPDEQTRCAIRDMAVIFAELAKSLVVWQRELGGWMMRESTVVNEWKNEGRQEGEIKNARASVMKVLTVRMKAPVPDPIRLAIEGTNAPDILERWLEIALETDSYPDFQSKMRPHP